MKRLIAALALLAAATTSFALPQTDVGTPAPHPFASDRFNPYFNAP